MSDRHTLDEIIAVKPDNSFLEYIVRRIQRDDYRGLHISQHNRYDLERLLKILRGIFSIARGERFRIPLGDDMGIKDPDCDEYYKIVGEVKRNSGIGTINSLKKNFFVDFHRMGLLYRYDERGDKMMGDERGHVYYGQLTSRSIKLLNGKIIERYKVFTDALDDLFCDETTNIANTIYYSKYKNDRISIDEFMLIMSDNRPEIRDKKIDLLDSYRTLARYQRERAIDLIKKYCNPDAFYGCKTERRDYHNWKNESQQIFSLLKNTVYFDITRQSLKLNTGMYGIFTDTQIRQRSLGAKDDYFIKHGICKRSGHELHHIVPFSSAKNKEEFKLIDDWSNLVYLTCNKHSEFVENGNRNIILFASDGILLFKDFDKSTITVHNEVDAWYSNTLIPKMLSHNTNLLKTVYEYAKAASSLIFTLRG